jgi:hypothetical protein
MIEYFPRNDDPSRRVVPPLGKTNKEKSGVGGSDLSKNIRMDVNFFWLRLE